MKQPYVVVFAGAQGSSKSIVAHGLSIRFNLPILNRDVIRSEVKEDLRVDDIRQPHALDEFEKRFEQRWSEALAAKQPFILDASVDRSWAETKRKLTRAGFRWFMIDMELSREFFEKLFTDTGRSQAIDQLGRYLTDHENFLREYKENINLEITDDNFGQRIQLAADGLQDFLKT